MVVAGLDVSELIELAFLLVAVGALSGFLAGVFGIGGGALLRRECSGSVRRGVVQVWRIGCRCRCSSVD